MEGVETRLGVAGSIPGYSVVPGSGGSVPERQAVAPAGGAKGACVCGEVHTSRPRITPTLEHTRLVEV